MLPDFSSAESASLEQLDSAIDSASGLRSSMDGTAQQIGAFRNAIASHPRMTTQYNKAKRHALNSLDALIKEIRSGCDRLVETQKFSGCTPGDTSS